MVRVVRTIYECGAAVTFFMLPSVPPPPPGYSPTRNVMQPPRGKEPDPDGGSDYPRFDLDPSDIETAPVFFPKVDIPEE